MLDAVGGRLMPLYSSTTHECGTAVESSEPPETSSQGVPAEIGTSTSSVTEVLDSTPEVTAARDALAIAA